MLLSLVSDFASHTFSFESLSLSLAEVEERRLDRIETGSIWLTCSGLPETDWWLLYWEPCGTFIPWPFTLLLFTTSSRRETERTVS